MRHIHFIHSNTSSCTGLLPDFKANKWLESSKMSCKYNYTYNYGTYSGASGSLYTDHKYQVSQQQRDG